MFLCVLNFVQRQWPCIDTIRSWGFNEMCICYLSPVWLNHVRTHMHKISVSTGIKGVNLIMRMIDMIDNTYMYGRYTELIQYHSIQIPSTIMYLSLDYFDNCSLPKISGMVIHFFQIQWHTYIMVARWVPKGWLTLYIHNFDALTMMPFSFCINFFQSDYAYMCQWTGSSHVKALIYCLLGAFPLHRSR